MNIIEYLNENLDVLEYAWKIIELFAPFVILGITLHDERKQNAKFKKQEVHMQYLMECMNWLNELQMMAYTVSRMGVNCLCTCNPEKFAERYNDFSIEASVMVEKCLVGISTYGVVAKTLGIPVNLNEVRKLTGEFTQAVRSNCKEILAGAEADEATNIINDRTEHFENEIANITIEVGKVFATMMEE